MKTLYLDCSMGAAGDMLAGALLELLPEPDGFIREVNALGIPNVRIERQPSSKCGIGGTHYAVTVNGVEEDEHIHEHHHEHEHHHHHHDEEHDHHHSSMHDIGHILSHLPVSEKVRENAAAVYRLIAEAESHAHGVPVTEIHFHEVGTMDAVADVVSVCMLLEKLAPDEIIASPIHVGSGQVRCAHGVLPVPAPATAHILRDVPIYGGKINDELCTPTGAALLKHFVTRFGDMPVMRVQAVGYGMGKKDFEAANCLRALWGTSESGGETVTELVCNIDDMTPEAVGFAMERLFEAGALDVYTVAAGMKKSRPGVLFTAVCKSEKRDEMIGLIFKHTTTLGIRENVSKRYIMNRRIETVNTPYGEVRKKVAEGYGSAREKYEYEDLARIARERDISIAEAEKLAGGQENGQ